MSSPYFEYTGIDSFIGSEVDSPPKKIDKCDNFQLQYIGLNKTELSKLILNSGDIVFPYRHDNIAITLNFYIDKHIFAKMLENSNHVCFLESFSTFLIHENNFIIVNNEYESKDLPYIYKRIKPGNILCDEIKTSEKVQSFELKQNNNRPDFLPNYCDFEGLQIKNFNKLDNEDQKFQKNDFNRSLKKQIDSIMRKHYIEKIIIYDIIEGKFEQKTMTTSSCYEVPRNSTKQEDIIKIFRKDNFSLILHSQDLYLNYNFDITINNSVGHAILENFKSCVNPINDINAPPYFIEDDSTYVCCYSIAHLKTFFKIIFEKYFLINHQNYEMIIDANSTSCRKDPISFSNNKTNKLKENFKSEEI
ncbi:hypothetical protein GVAV_000877 [Gurleya vavrai]